MYLRVSCRRFYSLGQASITGILWNQSVLFNPNSVWRLRFVCGIFLCIFLADCSTAAVPLELNVGALGIPAGNAAIIEEVSENFSGGVARVAAVSAGKVPAGALPPQSVWLVSIPSLPQSVSTISASADTVIGDGTSKNTPGGTATSLVVRSDGPSQPLLKR